jgi:hypothetical protein
LAFETLVKRLSISDEHESAMNKVLGKFRRAAAV